MYKMDHCKTFDARKLISGNVRKSIKTADSSIAATKRGGAPHIEHEAHSNKNANLMTIIGPVEDLEVLSSDIKQI